MRNQAERKAIMKRTADEARKRSAAARNQRLLDAVADAETSEPLTVEDAIKQLERL